MSKLQTAIQKITQNRDAKGPAAGKASTVAEPGAPESGEQAPVREYRNSVSVDLSRLSEQGVLLPNESTPTLKDEMRRIKWPILANAFGEQSSVIPKGNLVMVASAVSGDGKTFTTINLALSLAAEKEVDVLLVDADIAKPHISRVFGIEDNSGVIDYLSGDVTELADVVVGTDVPGLSLLPAGRADEHASELLASKRMSTLVSQIVQSYPDTIVLFDTSPILETNESQVLSRLAGQVLLVVAANKTPQPAVQEAVELLGEDLIVNVVFNRVSSLFKQKHRYGGYYGYKSRQ